jgi:uncharacterized membrane protein YhaH (DUF805 family)
MSKRTLWGILLIVLGILVPIAGVGATVLGMIQTFNEIAASPATARADELSSGASYAMVWMGIGAVVGLISFVCGIVVLVTSGRKHATNADSIA